jgi:hypothetical protein
VRIPSITAWKSRAKLLSAYAATAAESVDSFTLSMMLIAIAANAQNPIVTATKNPIAPNPNQ